MSPARPFTIQYYFFHYYFFSSRNGVELFFKTVSESHPENVSETIMWIIESSLGLPSKEYYLDPEKVSSIKIYRMFHC
jgi:predicted metalloendopeptidase